MHVDTPTCTCIKVRVQVSTQPFKVNIDHQWVVTRNINSSNQGNLQKYSPKSTTQHNIMSAAIDNILLEENEKVIILLRW